MNILIHFLHIFLLNKNVTEANNDYSKNLISVHFLQLYFLLKVFIHRVVNDHDVENFRQGVSEL